MKRTHLLLAGLAISLAHGALAADTPQAVADRMLDPTRNASAFKDPAAFTQWTGTMMNPATSMALMQQAMNPNTSLITGVVCGVRVENVDDPLMRKIRYLDKLIDELAKGKAMEKILRK